MQCDEQQKICITHPVDKPLVVVAGPGSGKTHVICQRIVHLIEQGIPEEGVLCVTFTTKAAREMQQRVAHLLGRSHRCPIQTIHSLGYSILREQAAHLGYHSGVKVISSRDRRSLISTVAMEMRLDLKAIPLKTIERNVDAVKSNGMRFPRCDVEDGVDPEQAALFEALATRYHTRLKENGQCDFVDMVMEPLTILRGEEWARQLYRGRHRHVLIDEFQDTSATQWEMLRLIIKHSAVTVVGDINQSIYAFRGADPEVFGYFHDTFPDATVRTLVKNYRSAAFIVAAAGRIIQNNLLFTSRRSSTFLQRLERAQPALRQVAVDDDEDMHAAPPKQAKRSRGDTAKAPPVGFVSARSVAEKRRSSSPATARKRARSGHSVVVAECGSMPDEIGFVVSQLEVLASRGGTAAVLCRTHEPLAALRAELTRRRIPFTTRATQPLGQNRVVQDVVAFLQIASDGGDATLLRRCFRPFKAIHPKDAIEYLEKVSQVAGAGKGWYSTMLWAGQRGYPADPNSATAAQSQRSIVSCFKGDPVSSHVVSRQVSKGVAKVGPGLNALLGMLQAVRRTAKASGVASAVDCVLKHPAYTGAPHEDSDSDETPEGQSKGAKGVRRKGSVSAAAMKAIASLRAEAAHFPERSTWQEALQGFCDHIAVSGWEDMPPVEETPGGRVCHARITVTTVHGAKGLEWDYVFVFRCNEGVMPAGARMSRVPKIGEQTVDDYSVGVDTELIQQLKEERRLCFVAMTRAAKWLCMSYVSPCGSAAQADRSRFIDELLDGLPGVSMWYPSDELPILSAPLRPEPPSPFAASAALLVVASSVCSLGTVTKRAAKAAGATLVAVCAAVVASRAAVSSYGSTAVSAGIALVAPVVVALLDAAVQGGEPPPTKRKKVAARAPAAKKKSTPPAKGPQQGGLSGWLRPSACTRDSPLADELAACTAGSRFRLLGQCNVCEETIPTTTIRRHIDTGETLYCAECGIAVDTMLEVKYSVGGKNYEETVNFITSRDEVAEMVRASTCGVKPSPRDVAARLLTVSRSIVWNALWHFGQLPLPPAAP